MYLPPIVLILVGIILSNILSIVVTRATMERDRVRYHPMLVGIILVALGLFVLNDALENFANYQLLLNEGHRYRVRYYIVWAEMIFSAGILSFGLRFFYVAIFSSVEKITKLFDEKQRREQLG